MFSLIESIPALLVAQTAGASNGGIWAAVIIVLVMVAIVLVKKGMVIVPQSKAVVIERLGKFSKVCRSGVNVINILWESKRLVYPGLSGEDRYLIDLREKTLDNQKQSVITSDNVTVVIDCILYYQITDPQRAVYEIDIAYLQTYVGQLTQTAVRNIIGTLSLDETLTSRERVNNELTRELDLATDKWGVKVNRVELQSIETDKKVEDTMQKQMTAEREKRALILEAEGKKQAAILEAQGFSEAIILEAEGRKKASILEAEGKAEAIRVVFDAINTGKPTKELIALKYIEALNEIAHGEANKVFIPYEANGLMGALGGIKELFTEEKGAVKKNLDNNVVN